MARFVLEIGTEEIPPRYFPVALPQLKADGEAMLERARLTLPETEAKVYGTPRRLALIAEGLAERQAPHTREERGPAERVAFDAEGKPTKAAVGFAGRFGLSPDDLVVKDTEQGRYVFAVIHDPELPAREALAPLLSDLITGLSFPKTMRWGTGRLRFGRPIRWLLALLDDQVVEFELDGIKSGRLTRGHPVLADGMHEVASAATYEEELKRRFVTVGPQERWDDVVKQVMDLSTDEGALVACPVRPWGYSYQYLLGQPEVFAREVETDLSLQITLSVERPTAAVGKFDQQHLRLPKPVLEGEMIHIQGYFPLAEGDGVGDLLPRFIAVRDGGGEHLDTLIHGWESVLRAKLIDASFFYEQDLKASLEERLDALRGVIFQEKLGTMLDKVERVRAVAANLARQLDLDEQRTAWLDQAAWLCKADLTTDLVAELPILQGTMGAIYAGEGGYPPEVTTAIGDHYRPRSATDDPPGTTIGILLAIADKIDTIAACFSAGIAPSGSADPLGLRREGTGIVKCFCGWSSSQDPALGWRLCTVPVSGLARVALEQLAEQDSLSRVRETVVSEVQAFLAQRLATYLREKEVRYDLVEAALAVGSDMLRDAANRAKALKVEADRDPASFIATVIAATRAINITKGFDAGHGDVDESLFREPAERDLWGKYMEAEHCARTLWGGQGQYDEARFYQKFFMDALVPLREPIDKFFDDVLVMHEDDALRRNRLAICWHINQLFRRLADFSLIVQV